MLEGTTPETPREKGQEPETPQTPPAAGAPETPPAPLAAPQTDFEKLYKESSAEALIWRDKAMQTENRLRELTTQPTDSELRAAFPDWEVMSDAEQRAARMAFEAKRSAEAVQAERALEKAESQWKNTVEAGIAANPSLDGHEAAFREFANMATHKGASMEVLVPAFLHKIGASTPPAPSTPKQGLEPGHGGPKVSEQPRKITVADLKVMRETDPKGYAAFIKTHDISEIE